MPYWSTSPSNPSPWTSTSPPTHPSFPYSHSPPSPYPRPPRGPVHQLPIPLLEPAQPANPSGPRSMVWFTFFLHNVPSSLPHRRQAKGAAPPRVGSNRPRMWGTPSRPRLKASRLQAPRLHTSGALPPLSGLHAPRYASVGSRLHASTFHDLRLHALGSAPHALGATLHASGVIPPHFWSRASTSRLTGDNRPTRLLIYRSP